MIEIFPHDPLVNDSDSLKIMFDCYDTCRPKEECSFRITAYQSKPPIKTCDILSDDTFFKAYQKDHRGSIASFQTLLELSPGQAELSEIDILQLSYKPIVMGRGLDPVKNPLTYFYQGAMVGIGEKP